MKLQLTKGDGLTVQSKQATYLAQEEEWKTLLMSTLIVKEWARGNETLDNARQADSSAGRRARDWEAALWDAYLSGPKCYLRVVILFIAVFK